MADDHPAEEEKKEEEKPANDEVMDVIQDDVIAKNFKGRTR